MKRQQPTPGGARSPLDLASPKWVRSLDRDAAIEQEDRATTTHRLQVGVKLAVAAWLGFVLVDWVVAAYITPEPVLHFLALRLIPGAVILGALVWLSRERNPSMRALYGIDIAVALTTAMFVSLLGLKHGGLTSPYIQGLTLVLIAESITFPVRWQRGVWLKVAIVVSFPLVAAVASLWQPTIAAQFGDPVTLALFGENLFFVATVALFALVGGHVTWSLRRQVFESKTVGRYRLKKRLEVGGMSEVWSAYHFALKHDVAVKIMQAPARRRDAALTRFEREVRALSTLKHPNAVRIYDFGVTIDGLWYYVMELLEGETMGSMIRESGPISPKRAVDLVRQACGALAEAHANGIVHRDVKPDNLFLTRLTDGQRFVKVVDFGIAKMITPEAPVSITGEGWIGGTPEYMSPEASSGREVGPETDVYALGSVLYFLLTGSPPFSASNPVEMLLAQVNVEPVSPSAHLPNALPPKLEALILRCLSKDAGLRFADAGELAVALDELDSLPDDAPTSPSPSASLMAAPTLEDVGRAIPAIARRLAEGEAS